MLFSLHSPRTIVAQSPSFPFPYVNRDHGTKDVSALAELKAFIQATSAAGWKDLTASGTVTLPGGDTHKATLYLSGANLSRLDILMADGVSSTRITGSAGRHTGRDGRSRTMMPTVARAGIVSLPSIWADPESTSVLSIYDRGDYTAQDKQTLHRITIEYPINPGPWVTGGPTAYTDLYFDSKTHLLLYSVDELVMGEGARPKAVRVTSYDKYRSAGGIEVPLTMEQYINGHQTWKFKFNSVVVNSSLQPGFFIEER